MIHLPSRFRATSEWKDACHITWSPNSIRKCFLTDTKGDIIKDWGESSLLTLKRVEICSRRVLQHRPSLCYCRRQRPVCLRYQVSQIYSSRVLSTYSTHLWHSWIQATRSMGSIPRLSCATMASSTRRIMATPPTSLFVSGHISSLRLSRLANIAQP